MFKKILVSVLLPALALAANTSTLTWPAVTTRTDGTALTNLQGYNVYRGTSASTLTKFANVPAPTTTYVDSTPVTGSTYYYAVTAIDANGLESAQSNIGSKSFAPPSSTTLTVAAAGGAAEQAYHGPSGDFLMRSVGQVAPLTPCDSGNGILCQGVQYYELPVASVTWAKTPQPPPIYSLCA